MTSAHGHDHFQVGVLVACVRGSRSWRRDPSRSRTEQGDERKPKPHRCNSSCIILLSMDESGVQQLLQAQKDAQLGVIPGEAALEIDGVGRADGPVGGELDGAALHEGAGGHDDLGCRSRAWPRAPASHSCPPAAAAWMPLQKATMASWLPSSTAWMMSWRLSRGVGHARGSPDFHSTLAAKTAPLSAAGHHRGSQETAPDTKRASGRGLRRPPAPGPGR